MIPVWQQSNCVIDMLAYYTRIIMGFGLDILKMGITLCSYMFAFLFKLR